VQIGDYVQIIKDIPPILSRGQTGKVRERWIPATETMPASWIVDFQSELAEISYRSHFVYEDEMKVLELRVNSHS